MKRKLKPIDSSKFALKFIKDLGMQVQKSGRIVRYVRLECGKCHIHLDTTVGGAERNKSCKSCASKMVNTRHGLSHTKVHQIWSGEKGRCHNKNDKDFYKYGARGIKMSEEFRLSFEVWFEYVKSLDGFERHKDKNMSIDRIDNDIGYERGNLRWATHSQQQLNKSLSSSNKSGFRGVTVRKNGFEASIRDKGKQVYIGYYKCRREAAYKFDNYVIEHNLENQTNIIPKGLICHG